MCHGDCIKCSFQQRIYCASYMARNNYAMIESVLDKLDSISSDMSEMKNKINEGELIRPFEEESTIKASGAEK